MTYSFIADVPFKNYIPVAAAPWGRFPNGPAYDVPPSSACPTCMHGLGAYYAQRDLMPARNGFGAYGDAGCGPCQVSSGGQCVPCPDGSGLPECRDCRDGLPLTEAPTWFQRHRTLGPILLGALTMATGALIVKQLTK